MVGRASWVQGSTFIWSGTTEVCERSSYFWGMGCHSLPAAPARKGGGGGQAAAVVFLFPSSTRAMLGHPEGAGLGWSLEAGCAGWTPREEEGGGCWA